MSDYKIDSLEVETQLIAPEATTLVAGLQSPSDKTKLDSVQSGATVNSTDAELRDRTTHTGTQLSSTISDFTTSAAAAAPVQSVAGQTGVVVLTKVDVGLSNVDNTSDLNKVVSNATQTALNNKENTGVAASLITAHEAALNPHPGYATDSDLSSGLALKYDASNPNGYETPAQLNTRDTDNRNRSNHTGTQLSSTISNFESTVLSTDLAGLVTTDITNVVATDTILQGFGKIQAIINAFRDRFFRVTVIQTTTSNVYSNVTQLTSTSLEVGWYKLQSDIIFQSTATTTGIGFRLNQNSAVLGTTQIRWNISTAASGTDESYTYDQIGLATNDVSTGVLTANADAKAEGYGIFQVTTAGTVAVQFRSEVNASGVSVRIGSGLIITRIE